MLREKIIKTAYELFGSKGFEKTTVSDIIKEAGTSKGGFYHHFKSKEEVLEIITIGYVDKLSDHYKQIFIEDDRSVIDQMNDVFIKINEAKMSLAGEWAKIHNIFSFKGNYEFFQKLADEFERVTAELNWKLIEKGVKQGIFKVKYPKLLAELWTREMLKIYSKTNQVICSKGDSLLEELKTLIDFSEEFMNNALGVSEKCIQIKVIILDYVENAKKHLPKH